MLKVLNSSIMKGLEVRWLKTPGVRPVEREYFQF